VSTSEMANRKGHRLLGSRKRSSGEVAVGNWGAVPQAGMRLDEFNGSPRRYPPPGKTSWYALPALRFTEPVASGVMPSSA
jgi:hypothetical protein